MLNSSGVWFQVMSRDEVLRILGRNAHDLRGTFAVRSLALFGSVARNRSRPDSDVDLLVEFDQSVGYFHLFRLQDHIQELLGGIKVDVIPRSAVIEELQDAIYGEAVNVFGESVGVSN